MPKHMKRSHKRKSRRSRRTRKRRGGLELEKMQACLRSGAGISACKSAAKKAAMAGKDALNKENLIKAAKKAAPIPTPKLAKAATQMHAVKKAADKLKAEAKKAQDMSRGAGPELREALREARKKNLAGGKRRRKSKRRRSRRKSRKSRRKSRKTKRRRKSKRRRSRRRRR